MAEIGKIETDQLLKEQTRRLTMLNNLVTKIVTAEDADDLFSVTAAKISELFRGNRVSLILTDDNGVTFKIFGLHGSAGALPAGIEFSLAGTTVELAITKNQVIVTPDLSKKLDFHENSKLIEQGLQSTLVAPLVTRKQILGSLNIGSRQINSFDQLDEDIARQLASLLATTIENRRLFAQAQRRATELEETTSALRKSEALLVKATENAPGMIYQFLLQPDGTACFPYVSAWVQEIFGLDPEALKHSAEPLIALIHPDDLAEFERTVAHSAQTLEIWQWEGRFFTKTGTVVFTRGQSKPELQTEGSILWSGVLIDISDRKQSEIALAKRVIELEAVADVSTVVATSLEPQTVLQLICDLTKDRFGLYHAHIYLLDIDSQILTLAAGAGEIGRQMMTEGWMIPLDQAQSLVAQAGRTKQGVIANDVRQAPDFLQNPLLMETRSEMAVPMLVGKQVVGVLDVQSDQKDNFNQDDIRIYTILASEVASAVKNAQLFETMSQAQANAENRLKETETLRQLIEALAGALRVDDVINAFFKACTKMLGFDYVIFSLVDKAELRVKAMAGLNVTNDHLRRANHSLDSGDIMADIVRSGKTEVITGWDPRFDVENFEAEQLADWGMRIFTPITLRRENIGLVEVGFNTNVETNVQESQMWLLRSLINQTAVALESAQRYEASRKAAHREQLLREITARVRGSADVDTVLRTTVLEVGKALGRPTFIYLGQEQNRSEEPLA
ncbi:MAG: GAF domain-containing protein [Anaerolineae bacterium]|nr:GAF domain-containing protein [Anaerolineae bacterium]